MECRQGHWPAPSVSWSRGKWLGPFGVVWGLCGYESECSLWFVLQKWNFIHDLGQVDNLWKGRLHSTGFHQWRQGNIVLPYSHFLILYVNSISYQNFCVIDPNIARNYKGKTNIQWKSLCKSSFWDCIKKRHLYIFSSDLQALGSTCITFLTEFRFS